MTPLIAGRITGSLFLAAFVLYGGGSALGAVPGGIALIFLNSIAVAAIGFLVQARLRPDAPGAAEGYFWARQAEAVLLAAGVWFLLADRPDTNALLYAAAMCALAVGSIPMLLALKRLQWFPSWFTVWGAIGYALLGIGAVMDFAVPGSGIFFSIPGGLFEIAFGVLLIRAGFPAQAESPAASRSR